ncbi:MAG: aldo/keto reductase [Clostridiales bacterium]|nr:aldo/keto reductase [Clostridiales bacterium]
MKYRELGNTGLKVSEVGLGGEWLEGASYEQVEEVVRECEKYGINILDCWMSEPNVRSNLGRAIEKNRDKWIVQGQLGSAFKDGQYYRTRDLEATKEAFEDLLMRFRTDYIDIGLIHYVDEEKDYRGIMEGPFIEYAKELKEQGKIRHIGMGTHNPKIAKMAVESGIIEVILFSINPAFDMLPPTEDINEYFVDEYDEKLGGIDPEKTALYQLCEQKGVGITVMKGYAGGRLFDEKRSPFGVALTPVQCLHYCLTRPAVASVMVGFSNIDHVREACSYETASDEEKDYASVLASAPKHAFGGECTYCGHCQPCPMGIHIAMVNKFYDLAAMQSEVPASIREHYFAMEKNASDCIGCKSCETRCPFGVNIAERMLKTKTFFE